MPCATHTCPVTCLGCCEPCLPAVRASHYPCMPRDMPWLLRALSASRELQRKDDGSASPLPLPNLAVLILLACTARLLNRLAGHKHEWVAAGISTRLTAIAVEVGIGLLRARVAGLSPGAGTGDVERGVVVPPANATKGGCQYLRVQTRNTGIVFNGCTQDPLASPQKLASVT